MMQHPAIIALVGSSLMISGMMLYAGWYGIRILRSWNLASGSELQLSLERRTYLVSVILGYTLAFQVLSLFLFIYTADSTHNLFVGAMCAAGSLSVNGYGYPVLLLKISNCILAGVWLLLSGVDVKGYDYPLIKPKYALLLLLLATVLLETVLQFAYFSGLRADVITSCCGSLFSSDKRSIAGEIAGLPVRPTLLAFVVSLGGCLASGVYFRLRGRGSYLFAALSTLFFPVAIAALISFFSLYYYELPTHHCPFCILQQGYHYVGYLLYACLMGGAVAGLGVGVLAPFHSRTSLLKSIPAMQRRLTTVTLVLYGVFTSAVVWKMATTSFTLGIFDR